MKSGDRDKLIVDDNALLDWPILSRLYGGDALLSDNFDVTLTLEPVNKRQLAISRWIEVEIVRRRW